MAKMIKFNDDELRALFTLVDNFYEPIDEEDDKQCQ